MPTKAMPTPESQIEEFIDRYTPEVASVAREVLQRMRARLPGATELIYDNYNALAIGFGATERSSDAVFSVALFPRWVSLFFIRGVELPDPHGLLCGGGNQVRHIVLEDAAMLDDPRVQSLMEEALLRARAPIDPEGPRKLVIKSISARQRPRRPSG